MLFSRMADFRRILELTLALGWRDVAARYRGSSLGLLWTLLGPMMMLAVYSVAFGYVFKARWPNLSTQGSFVELLFLGIAVHGFFAECLNRSPSVITHNPSYVKRVVFPLGTLPPLGMALATLLSHNDGRDYGSEPNRLPVVVKQAQAAIFQEAFRRATSACAAAGLRALAAAMK